MLKEEQDGDRINSCGRICDSAPRTVCRRVDSANLCTGCDLHIHAATGLASRQERMWICESCKCAPAAFICKADAASLCTTCDADIHSANPLAQRHQRVPIGSLYGPQVADPGGPILGIGGEADDGFLDQETDEAVDEDEAASWLLINPVKNNHNQIRTNGLLFGGEAVDEYLDFVEYNLCQDNRQQNGVPQKSYGGDSVVPVPCGEAKIHQFQQQQKFQLEMDYETSNTGYGYPASLGQSVSVSSTDVGVVPQSTTSGVSISHPRPSKGTIDLFSIPPIQMPTQLTPMDREARVLRYREKKKTRRFEKTIRYASRKAYAETRPRIKGRFTKRTDVDVEVDQMFSSTLMAENGGGIVPSFQIQKHWP